MFASIDMINTLTTAQINGTLRKGTQACTSIPRYSSSIGWAILPFDNREAGLLFQVVAARYKSGSIVLTTNCRFRDGGKIIDINSTFVTATIDRLVHYREAYVFTRNQLSHDDNTQDAD